MPPGDTVVVVAGAIVIHVIAMVVVAVSLRARRLRRGAERQDKART